MIDEAVDIIFKIISDEVSTDATVKGYPNPVNVLRFQDKFSEDEVRLAWEAFNEVAKRVLDKTVSNRLLDRIIEVPD